MEAFMYTLPFHLLFSGRASAHSFFRMLFWERCCFWSRFSSSPGPQKCSPIAVCAVALMGIDPAYIFTWRTEGYIPAFPATFVLLALWLILKADDRDDRRRLYALGGLWASRSGVISSTSFLCPASFCP
jgi:hypothetical protein